MSDTPSAPADPDIPLHDFTAPCRSLDWLLGQAYWSARGLEAFTTQEVPNLSNNDGMGAARAAVTLFAACETAAPQGPIAVAEVGVGMGLHARLMLDRFRDLCTTRNRDYYHRLTLYAGDTSRATLEHIRDRGVLASHAAHVRISYLDATNLDTFVDLSSRTSESLRGKLHAVVCNYLLDVLPFELVERTLEGWARVEVRTLLHDLDALTKTATLSVERIVAFATSMDPESLRALRAVAPFMKIQQRARLFDPREIELGEAFCAYLKSHADPYVTDARKGQRSFHVNNHGAVRLLDRALSLLAPGGFVLVNDYGPVSVEQACTLWTHQRFSGSTAMGVNFPWVEHWLTTVREKPAHVSRPAFDDIATLHARIYTNEPATDLHVAFCTAFDRTVFAQVQGLLEHAQKADSDGKGERVRQLLLEAHALAPENWLVLARLGQSALRFASARTAEHYLRRALEFNPVTSAETWNDLGDALYVQENHAGAMDAYAQAERANPEDARCEYNRAWVLAAQRDYPRALEACGRALARDRAGRWTDRVLRKQTEILEARAKAESVMRERTVKEKKEVSREG